LSYGYFLNIYLPLRRLLPLLLLELLLRLLPELKLELLLLLRRVELFTEELPELLRLPEPLFEVPTVPRLPLVLTPVLLVLDGVVVGCLVELLDELLRSELLPRLELLLL
jgi:hypothetical protein